MRDATASFSSYPHRQGLAGLAIGATIGLLVAGCGGSSSAPASQGGHARGGASENGVRLSITPASGSRDRQPGRGITVKAAIASRGS
jgi:hypothetical protein